jgi:hypothetical protein
VLINLCNKQKINKPLNNYQAHFCLISTMQGSEGAIALIAKQADAKT